MRQGLGLPHLRVVVDRKVHEALKELEVLEVLCAQIVELTCLTAREGEDLIHVRGDCEVTVKLRQDRGDDDYGDVAVYVVASLAVSVHELRVLYGSPSGVPSYFGPLP